MREKLRDILRDCPAWDGRAYNLTVTDTTPSTMEVRALATAKDASDIWTVRVTVREQMIRWLAAEHPYALPRVNAADAVLPPAHNRHSSDTVPPARRVHRHPKERGGPQCPRSAPPLTWTICEVMCAAAGDASLCRVAATRPGVRARVSDVAAISLERR